MVSNDISKQKAKWWMRWCVYTTFFPLVLVVIFDAFLGYSIEQIFTRHFLELVLLVFTIAVNIFASVIDSEGQLEKNKRGDYIWRSASIAVVCIVCFCLFYLVETKNYMFVIGSRIIIIVMAFYIVYKGRALEIEKGVAETEQQKNESISKK